MKRNFTLKKFNSLFCIFPKSILVKVLFCVFIVLGVNLRAFSKPIPDAKVAKEWAKLTLHILKTTKGGSPTFNSRFLGYVGLTMYESVVKGSKNQLSLVGKINGLEYLPQFDQKRKINWVLSLNAGQAQIIKHLYGFTASTNLTKIDSLEKIILQSNSLGFKAIDINASIDYGKKIADAIYEYSKTDGGHLGYLDNFDSTFVIKKGNGLWTPPIKGQSEVSLPLHPKWGSNRTFSKANYVLPIPEMMEYDFSKGSVYYNYMKEVFDVRNSLSQEQKEIANWWGDDPSQTFSPPGHSYYIALVAVEKSNSNLFVAAQTFSAVGMAVADAFVNCWKTKYHYNAERPFSFIYYNMSTLWDLYWPEPPFPAFYSGHAGQASSAATVLTKLYGASFAFVDDAHFGRPMDMERLVEYKPRKFNSFFQSAEESAMSRLYGGIHTRLDNEIGLKEGKKIGQNIIDLYNK